MAGSDLLIHGSGGQPAEGSPGPSEVLCPSNASQLPENHSPGKQEVLADSKPPYLAVKPGLSSLGGGGAAEYGMEEPGLEC